VSDLLIRQRMRQDSTRWFVLHVVANIVVSISAAPDMLACLANPLVDPIGPVSVLPVYMIPCLFVYHLISLHVPKDEWVHHVLFGGGIGGAGLYFAPGPLQNALAFFICGLPGGIDYAMLAMVKEGYISSATEKVPPPDALLRTSPAPAHELRDALRRGVRCGRRCGMRVSTCGCARPGCS
jgi:hypothetical protein